MMASLHQNIGGGDSTYTPRVSVIIPVFNGEKDLKRAVDSLLSQTMEDFEIIILDDGSTDGTWELIQTFKDARVRAFSHANVGIALTLNRGIELARGAYIARLDHDDVSLPTRLAKQCEVLDAHADIVLVGTRATVYYEQGVVAHNWPPLTTKALQFGVAFRNRFNHSAVMIRKNVLLEMSGYVKRPAEDYDLWSRIVQRYAAVNLGEVLTLNYVLSENNLTLKYKNEIQDDAESISAAHLHTILAPDFSFQECQSLSCFKYVNPHGEQMTHKKAQAMIMLVAHRVGGNEGQWSEDFRSEVNEILLSFKRRFRFAHVPVPLRKFAHCTKEMVLDGYRLLRRVVEALKKTG